MGTVVQFPHRRRDDAEALLEQIRRLVEGGAGVSAEDELERLRSRLAAVVRWHPPDAAQASTDEDVARLLGDWSRRVHVVEEGWLDRIRLARDEVEPLELVELGDLAVRHAQAGIELRALPELRALRDEVVASTLEFSGIRLRNAR